MEVPETILPLSSLPLPDINVETEIQLSESEVEKIISKLSMLQRQTISRLVIDRRRSN